MTEQPNMIRLDADEQRLFKRGVSEGRPYFERISLGMCMLLLYMRQVSDDANALLTEMDFLEGLAPTSTKRPASQFGHPPLAPFWHKHVFMSRNIVGNLGSHWGFHHKKELPPEQHGNRRFSRMVDEVCARHDEVSEEFIRDFTAEFIDKPFWERMSTGPTGDWLIFARHQEQNYYLGYARHSQSREDDEATFKYLKNTCAAEYPFVFE